MPIPIIETKLNIPSVNNNLVKRVLLEQLLISKPDCALTLVSSFAGSGKSTAMAMYAIKHCDNCVWYSLDDSDNDIHQFMAYLLKGTYRHSALTELEISDSVKASIHLDVQLLSAMLINAFRSIKKELTIIFDDFHLISSLEIHNLLINLIDFLPNNVHIMIVTRVNPPFPLAKWRSKGKLFDIGMSDLKFCDDEVTNFFNKMKIALSNEDICLLNRRAEGWIGGLKLIALYMTKDLDNAEFIPNFSGNHCYIMTYLFEEVLFKESKQVIEFLLCTSVLPKFCASLCDKIMGYPQGTSQKLIDYIQQANLFVIPLDHENKWYRYHYLFSDILNTKRNESDYDNKKYHKLASEWFKNSGDVEAAVFHALRADDIEYTASIIENALLEKKEFTYEQKFYRLVKKLPDDIIKQRPIIHIGYIWCLINRGYFDTAIERLRNIEKQLKVDKDELIFSNCRAYDNNSIELLPALIEIIYAYINATTRETTALVEHTNRAVSLLGDKKIMKHSETFSLLSFSYWHQGDFRSALEMMDKAYFSAVDSESKIPLINIRLVQIEIRIQIGLFKDAEILLHQTIETIADQASIAYATLELKLAEINLLRGEIEQAETLLESSFKRANHICLPDFFYKWHVVKSEILTFNHCYDEALEHIDWAQRNYYPNPIPDRCSIQALRDLCYIRSKLFNKADYHVDINSDVSECQKLVYCEYMLDYTVTDSAKIKHVLKIVDSMLVAVKEAKRHRSIVDILLYKARILFALDKQELAAENVQQALEYAMRERYVAPFIINFDKLLLMYRHLYIKAEKKYLLNELVIKYLDSNMKKHLMSVQHDESELLTKREKDILKLLGKGYSNKAICEELFLALSTVKGYNRNIFDKLEVRNRTEAVCKARETNLL